MVLHLDQAILIGGIKFPKNLKVGESLNLKVLDLELFLIVSSEDLLLLLRVRF